MDVCCDRCTMITRNVAVWPLRCGCGHRIAAPTDATAARGLPSGPTINVRRIRRPICDACPHRTADDHCDQIPAGSNRIEGSLGLPNPSAICPAGKWAGPFRRGRVGFLSVAYMPIGGTEVWHQTLIPHLADVAGFVALEPELARGDFARLPCTTAVGLDAARQLAAVVDVLVVWGVGARLGEVLERHRPAAVSVSHCDHSSQWTTDSMHAQAPWTDHCVYLCPTGRDTCPADLPATWIPNAPDPARIATTEPRPQARQQMRERLGIHDDEKLVVAISRLSPEKRIDHILDGFKYLPPTYRLAIAGTSAGWSHDHADHLRTLADDRVQFLGNVDPPADLLAAADVYVSASEHEGYGLATAEAILAGVPVASTAVGLLETHPHLAHIIPHDATPRDVATAIQGALFDPPAPDAQSIDTVDRFAAAWQHLIEELAP